MFLKDVVCLEFDFYTSNTKMQKGYSFY